MSLGTYTSQAVVHLSVVAESVPGSADSKSLIKKLSDYVITNRLVAVSGYALTPQRMEGNFTPANAAIIEEWLTSNGVKKADSSE